MTEARSNRATCQEKRMSLEVAYSQTLCFLLQGSSSARMEIKTAENLLKQEPVKVNRKMVGLGTKKIFSRSDLVHVLRTRSRVLVNFRKEKENDVCAQATLEVLKSGS